MEYKIIASDSIEQMDINVQDKISEGWTPIGGVSSTASKTLIGHFPNGEKEYIDIIAFHQAMTRTCKPSKTSKKTGLQPKTVINLWNEIAPAVFLPRKLKVIPSLEQSIRNRINEKDGFATIEAWRSYFNAICRSSFLTGKNDRRWKADLNWAVKPKSIANVIEGKYHG